MTLALIFKGTEGIVLAADSRVTLQFQAQAAGVSTPVLLSAHFDNATKLLKVQGQSHVAAVTYGLGSLGTVEPRTAHSYVPEFETQLGNGRLSVQHFAQKLSDFFMAQHQASNTPAAASDMHFLVGGYDEGSPYGRVFEIAIPGAPAPVEHNGNGFGLIYGGQGEITSRILNGFDPSMPQWLGTRSNLDTAGVEQLRGDALKNHGLNIPYQFLPLQDCVDLSILLVETTAQLMEYTVGVRGVGGAIDVATITRADGYKPIQVKCVKGKGHGGQSD